MPLQFSLNELWGLFNEWLWQWELKNKKEGWYGGIIVQCQHWGY